MYREGVREWLGDYWAFAVPMAVFAVVLVVLIIRGDDED